MSLCFGMGYALKRRVGQIYSLLLLGHDFRRDYSQLGMLIKDSLVRIFFVPLVQGQLRFNYPEINITLLTATATPRVQQDILQQLNITGNYKLFLQSFNRSNLIYECIPKKMSISH